MGLAIASEGEGIGPSRWFGPAELSPCGYWHGLVSTELGQLEPRDAPRHWRTVAPTSFVSVAHDSHARHALPEHITLPAGVRLRYDQFDYIDDWGWGADWHRFFVLDGEFAGRCVEARGPNFYGAGDPPPFPSTIEPVSEYPPLPVP